MLNQFRIEFDAARTRTTPCRTDHIAPVPRTEIYDKVLRGHRSHVEHLLNHRRGVRHPDDVLAFLTDQRLIIGPGGNSACPAGRHQYRNETGNRQQRLHMHAEPF